MAKWKVINGGYVFFDKANRPHEGGAIIDDQDPMVDINGQMHKLEPVPEPAGAPQPSEETLMGGLATGAPGKKPEEVTDAGGQPTADGIPGGEEQDAAPKPQAGSESRSL